MPDSLGAGHSNVDSVVAVCGRSVWRGGREERFTAEAQTGHQRTVQQACRACSSASSAFLTLPANALQESGVQGQCEPGGAKSASTSELVRNR
eukprot:3829610-Pleurochrysis_carterae.AAC.2